MSKDCSTTSNNLNDREVIKRRFVLEWNRPVHKSGNQHGRGQPFCHIGNNHKHSCLPSKHTKHIRAAGITTTMLPDINPATVPGDNDARRYGTREIAENCYDCYRYHSTKRIEI